MNLMPIARAGSLFSSPKAAFLLLLVLAALGGPCPAGEQGDYFQLSLQDLQEIKVSTASVRELPLSRQPATMTVFTSSEIKGLGARYLLDVLENVPGMFPAVDVFGVISLGFRGHWAHEGKILLLIDDMPVNDLLYGNLNLALHYPVEQIQRVEILRGAGPAKYGGNAQVAVIRVYTRRPAAAGSWVAVGVDQVNAAGAGARLSAGVNGSRGDLEARVTASYADHQWSGDSWRDNGGRRHDLDDETWARTANVIMQVDRQGLGLRGMFDRHETLTPHKHGDSRPGETLLFESFNVLAFYDLEMAQNWQARPRLLYRDQRDWWITRDPSVNPISDFHLPAYLLAAGLDVTGELENLSLMAGAEFWREGASAESAGGFDLPPETYYNGAQEVDYDGRSLFAQVDWLRDRWLVSGGLRYNHHEYAGSSLVPRLAVAYDPGSWYFKAQFGKAFRDPDIDVINSTNFADSRVEPEKTRHFEIEAGCGLGANWQANLALFRLELENPIIYTSTDAGYFFRNNDPSTTAGAEVCVRGHFARAHLRLGLSRYEALESPPAYLVPGHDDHHLGIPRQQAHLALDWRLGGGFSLHPNLLWQGRCFAYDYEAGASDPDGDEIAVRELDGRAFLHLALKWRRGNVELGLGARNLLDETRLYPQPFNDASTPWVGPGRTAFLSLAVDWTGVER